MKHESARLTHDWLTIIYSRKFVLGLHWHESWSFMLQWWFWILLYSQESAYEVSTGRSTRRRASFSRKCTRTSSTDAFRTLANIPKVQRKTFSQNTFSTISKHQRGPISRYALKIGPISVQLRSNFWRPGSFCSRKLKQNLQLEI